MFPGYIAGRIDCQFHTHTPDEGCHLPAKTAAGCVLPIYVLADRNEISLYAT